MVDHNKEREDTIMGYYNNGLNVSQIAKKVNCKKDEVWRVIHKNK